MAERKAERKGYVRRMSMRLQEGADQVMKAWKTQARRADRVGDLSYRGLELVHSGLGVAVRSLSRLERGTQPPHRTAKAEPHPHAPETHAHAAKAHPGPAAAARAHAAPRRGARPERHEPEPSAS